MWLSAWPFGFWMDWITAYNILGYSTIPSICTVDGIFSCMASNTYVTRVLTAIHHGRPRYRVRSAPRAERRSPQVQNILLRVRCKHRFTPAPHTTQAKDNAPVTRTSRSLLSVSCVSASMRASCSCTPSARFCCCSSRASASAQRSSHSTVQTWMRCPVSCTVVVRRSSCSSTEPVESALSLLDGGAEGGRGGVGECEGGCGDDEDAAREVPASDAYVSCDIASAVPGEACEAVAVRKKDGLERGDVRRQPCVHSMSNSCT